MADVSPTSVRSQLLNDDDEDEDENKSVSGFVSQLPFTTQVPYATTSYKSRIHPPHVLEELRNPPAASAQMLKQPSPEKPGTASHLLGNERSPHNAAVEVIHQTSSNGSLDCQPLRVLPESKSNSPVQDPGMANVRHCESQPFPLVDWIRTIRADTGKKRSTLSLKWTRSISKAQKAILAAEDAWMPPLPGRPQRQGTVPIDILNILTTRADREAEITRDQEWSDQEEHPHQEAHDVAKHIAATASSPPDLPAPDESEEGDNSESEAETVEALDWSSSPPDVRRPCLPPDTSPVRQIDRHASRPLQNMQNNMLDTIEDQSRPIPGQLGEALQNVCEDLGGPQVAQQEEEDPNPDPRADRRPASLQLEVTDVAESQPEDYNADDEHAHIAKVIPPLPSNVQVKETLYSLKDNPALRKQKVLSSSIPQSSFVLATFSDGVRAQAQSNSLHQPRIDSPGSAQNASGPSSGSPHQTRSRQASQQSSLPRQSLTANLSPRVNAFSHSQPMCAIQQQQLRSTPLQSCRNSKCIAGIAESSARKRSRNESEALEIHSDARADPDYQELDEQRKKARREFYRSRSKHETGKLPVPAPKPITEIVRENTRTSSMGSSPPPNRQQNLHYDSEGNTTSETNTSIHDSVFRNTPGTKVSRRPSLHIDQGDPYLASLFTKFKVLYSSYRGSEKSFLSALQLLSRLRAHCKEPHSFLWDDFIHRLAHDYKVYLQACIEQDESAVPYEVYYHQQVAKPEYLRGCVNADVLDELKSRRRGLKRSLSGGISHTSVQLEPTSASESAAEHVADALKPEAKSASTRIPPATTIKETPALQRYSQPRLQSMRPPARAPRQEQSVLEQTVHPLKNAELKRKRCSLPWSTNLSNASETAPVPKRATLAPENMYNLKSTPEPSAKVEKWLSRAPGGESPELLPQEPSVTSRAVLPELLPEEEMPTPPPPPSNTKEATLDSDRSNANHTLIHNINTSTLRLPAYLAVPGKNIVKSIESPPQLPSSSARTSELGKSACKRIRRSELPATLFTMFARNYGNLAEEKRATSVLPDNVKGEGINIYSW